METPARKLPVVARVLLGLAFTVFGANALLGFMPVPPVAPAAGAFLGALAATGYLLPLLVAVEVGAGLMLLTGRAVPLALVLLAPLLVNIVAFHLFLDPAGLAVPIVLVAVELYLAWTHRDAFAPLFRARAPRDVGRRAAPGRVLQPEA